MSLEGNEKTLMKLWHFRDPIKNYDEISNEKFKFRFANFVNS